MRTRRSAARNLERWSPPPLEATLPHHQRARRATSSTPAAEISAGMAAYPRIVCRDAGSFTDYFFAATPIARSRTEYRSSRPTPSGPGKVRAAAPSEDMRAIPAELSWGQCRMALPG
ncbi:MAG: phosphoenolpyruvate carboxylase [Betaproteobacteria bacterium]|nr:phosphoenolpyruvate carboxylase [Betaproteobacteria bacterium]